MATASMTRQIEVLVEDQILRRQELDLLRRQLDASTTSALDAQSRDFWPAPIGPIEVP